MSKHFLKKYEGRQPTTAMAIPKAKKARYATQAGNTGPSFNVSSECTIESRRISVSTNVMEYNTDTHPGVYEVVCCSHCSKFETLLESIKTQLEDLKIIVETQNIGIMDEMSAQKVATEQLVRQEVQNAPVTKYFPICQIQELQDLEKKITTDNRDVYESAVSAILCNNVKNIKLLFNADVINELNVDGTHNKIALKSFPNFYSTLTGAIAKMPFKGLSPEEMLRKAISFEKAKFFKRAYRQKKKTISSAN